MLRAAALAAGLCAVLWAGQAQALIYGCDAYFASKAGGGVDADVVGGVGVHATWSPPGGPGESFLIADLAYDVRNNRIGALRDIEIRGEVPPALRGVALKGTLVLRLDGGRAWTAPWDGEALETWTVLVDGREERVDHRGLLETLSVATHFADAPALFAQLPAAKRLTVAIEGGDHRLYGLAEYDLTPTAERNALFAKALRRALNTYRSDWTGERPGLSCKG